MMLLHDDVVEALSHLFLMLILWFLVLLLLPLMLLLLSLLLVLITVISNSEDLDGVMFQKAVRKPDTQQSATHLMQ